MPDHVKTMLLILCSTFGIQLPTAVADDVVGLNRSIENVIADYDLQVQYARAEPVERHIAGRVLVQDGGTRVYHSTFARLGALSRYDAQMVQAEPEPGALLPQRESMVFAEDRVERLIVTDGESRGTILAHDRLPSAPIEIALGIRAFRSTQRIGRDELARMERLPLANGHLLLRHQRAGSVEDQWTIDPDLQAPVKYRRVFNVAGDYDIEAVMGDFREVEGLMLPFTATIRYIHVKDDETITWKTETVTVKEYRINSPENRVENYAMVWPEGTRILDKRTGLILRIQNGAKRVGDDRIFDEAATRALLVDQGMAWHQDTTGVTPIPRPSSRVEQAEESGRGGGGIQRAE